nr:hypothetical protein BaRGS_032409 [Batillaria attramentaria]
MVLQFVQLVESVDRYDAQTVVLFLTLTQSLLAPHVLWLLSRRYRHALVYTWTVHVLRDDSAKEEGRIITTDLDDGMTVITNLASNKVTYVYDTSGSADAGRKEQGFHYYMSGDFHYDYLRGDSLPPFAHQESESEGGSFLYDDNDIEGILDREHSSRSRSSSATVTTFLDTEEEFHPKDGASVMGLLLQEEPSDAQQRGLERDTEFKHPDDERVYSQPSGQRTSHSGTDNDNGQSASAKTQSVDAAVAPDDSESNSSLHTDDHDGQRERMITRVHSGVSPPPTAVVLDILETSSTGSDHSVVLEPYNEDRRPPWMDADLDDEEDGKYSRSYFGNPFLTHVPNSSEDSDVFGSSGDFGSSGGPFTFGDSVNSARSSSRNPFRSASFENSSTRFFSHEPLLSESDSDTPQSSGNSGQLRGIRELNAGIFDHETEMGFEEALATDHMAGAPHFYGNMGLCFESIEEEPEEFSDSMTSSNKDGDDSIFKTQAIVSRPSSRNSIVDSGSNPFTSGNSAAKFAKDL